jgi:hypothetical protein
MQEDFKELTNAIFKFFYTGDEASLRLIEERRKEIKKIDAHFVPPGVAKPEASNFIVHYAFLKWGDFQIRGEHSSNAAFKRLEFLHDKLGILISVMDNEIDLALHKFLIRKTSADLNLLEQRREEIKMVTEYIENTDEMKVTIELSNGKITNGFFIKGKEEVGSAIAMLYTLELHKILKVKNLGVVGLVDPYIATRLKTLRG